MEASPLPSIVIWGVRRIAESARVKWMDGCVRKEEERVGNWE